MKCLSIYYCHVYKKDNNMSPHSMYSTSATRAASGPCSAFCKVCFDAKKPESVYTSHFVKDVPGFFGKIVCPTLLQQQCQYCKSPGHTVSYCAVLKKKEKMVRAMKFKCALPKTTKTTTVCDVGVGVGLGMYHNSFSIICDDDDCDDDCDDDYCDDDCDFQQEMSGSNFVPQEKEKEKEHKKESCVVSVSGLSYAFVAALPPSVPVHVPLPLPLPLKKTNTSPSPSSCSAKPVSVPVSGSIKKTWIDMDDSSDDDDY